LNKLRLSFFRYQQAIVDWQSWADTQNLELSNLQTSLSQYVEAYNTVSAELAQLQSAATVGDANATKDEEIVKLKAAVFAKGIEIEDLVSFNPHYLTIKMEFRP
jgi:hypothetical protein